MKLEDKLKAHFRITTDQERALKKLGIESVKDLLYHFPRSHADSAEVKSIGDLEPALPAVIFGTITGLKTKKGWKSKIPMAEARVSDKTGSIKIIWFHQAYLAKMIHDGTLVRVEGTPRQARGERSLYFSNPKIEALPDLFSQKAGHTLFPIYPESRGVTSNWIYHKIEQILNSGVLNEIEDPIPEPILKRYNLPNLKTALVWIHTPKENSHAEIARKRFAFEEILFIQLEKELARAEASTKNAFVIKSDPTDVQNFIRRFPFTATKAQEQAISAILKDFTRGYPMSRLLEGDVGSGKTAVAATASYAVVRDKRQVAYMAPTEILAKQHFESFIQYFRHLPVQIALITGSGCYKFPSKVNPNGFTDISRSQLLKWVANGEIAVVVGTHALIQKSVRFKNLALAVVDEQHRFGVNQRQKLVNREGAENVRGTFSAIPHLLSMTATPIPRTLALTVYGDLDLTLLDEMPAGRKRISTRIVTPEGRQGAYDEITKELEAGRQLYVICPRISEPDEKRRDTIQAKSVKLEAERLKKNIFPQYRIAILHSKMRPDDKERVMQEFKQHKIDILVSTSVVEVGVSVENASLIIIEGAERFGLAQLHQLRGRVLRGTHQPYCFVFAESHSPKILERLKALTEAKNGFELAELDMKNRGTGALSGTKQWGLSDLGMEAIKNLKMVEAARAEARNLVEEDTELESYPKIRERLAQSGRKIHFE